MASTAFSTRVPATLIFFVGKVCYERVPQERKYEVYTHTHRPRLKLMKQRMKKIPGLAACSPGPSLSAWGSLILPLLTPSSLVTDENVSFRSRKKDRVHASCSSRAFLYIILCFVLLSGNDTI